MITKAMIFCEVRESAGIVFDNFFAFSETVAGVSAGAKNLIKIHFFFSKKMEDMFARWS